MEARRSGKEKAEIQSEYGATIGVYDASFEVYPGEIFVVIGLSGSGKSTLLRLINRLIEPSEGEVYLGEEPISKLPQKKLREIRRNKMGMVFQHFGLLPNRTVLENIVFGLEVQGMSRQARNDLGAQTLDMVGLEGQADKKITELSGGMQQRVGLARALATKQEILLMDEPFSALDPLIRRDMQNLFLDIQGEIKRTVVFITHDLDEALRLGHRAAIMKDGEIVQSGTPEEILRNPADEYVQRFIEDVDYTKVRQAEAVMVEPKEVAYIKEGPRVVLRRMRKAGLSTICVLDKHGSQEGHLLGLARAEKLQELDQKGVEDLGEAVDESIPRVSSETPLREVLPLFVDSNLPVTVVGKQGRLKGVIVRGSLIAGLGAEAVEREKHTEGEKGSGSTVSHKEES